MCSPATPARCTPATASARGITLLHFTCITPWVSNAQCCCCRWKDTLLGCFKAGRYRHLLNTHLKVNGKNVYRLLAPAAT